MARIAASCCASNFLALRVDRNRLGRCGTAASVLPAPVNGGNDADDGAIKDVVATVPTGWRPIG